MTVQTLHIPLPAAIIQRLQHVAETTHRPLEEVVVQTICGNLPPALDDLSPALREVVADLPTLSDEALWAVARTSLPPSSGGVISASCGKLRQARSRPQSSTNWRPYGL